MSAVLPSEHSDLRRKTRTTFTLLSLWELGLLLSYFLVLSLRRAFSAAVLSCIHTRSKPAGYAPRTRDLSRHARARITTIPTIEEMPASQQRAANFGPAH